MSEQLLHVTTQTCQQLLDCLLAGRDPAPRFAG